VEGDPGGAAMVVVEGDPAGAAVALEGEENVAKKARRLSFDERSCTVNTLEDDLEDDGGFYNDYDYDEDYLPWISDSESDVEVCCLRSIY